MGDYDKVFTISVKGDHTPLLDSVVDDSEFIAYSLKDSAGVDCKIKTVRVNGKIFKLQFLDVSEQDQFQFLRSKFKPYATIIVYDTTAMVSFNNAKMWLEENAILSNGSVCMLLVGNDHNLDDNKIVNTDMGKELAKRFEIPFIETSAEHPTELEQALRNMTEFIESSKIYKTGAIQMEG